MRVEVKEGVGVISKLSVWWVQSSKQVYPAEGGGICALSIPVMIVRTIKILCRCWHLCVPTESGRNLSASGVTCPPLADRLTYNHIGANKSIFYGLAFLRYCHNIPEIIFQSKLLVGFRHKWRDR